MPTLSGTIMKLATIALVLLFIVTLTIAIGVVAILNAILEPDPTSQTVENSTIATDTRPHVDWSKTTKAAIRELAGLTAPKYSRMTKAELLAQPEVLALGP